MKLYIIRHGETRENVGSLLMGRTDGELSPLGEEQAKLTGHALKHVGIKKIYTSPLGRCKHTAEIINESLNVVLESDDRLIERDFGTFTNANAKTIQWDFVDTDSPESRAAGIESLLDIELRIERFIEAKTAEHHTETILVVTHNNPLRLFYTALLGKTYQEVLREYKIHNCGISAFEVAHGQPSRIVLLDEVDHLMKGALYI